VANVKQHRLLHGVIIPQFLTAMSIDVTKESIDIIKIMFKKHLDVESLSALSDAKYSTFISAVIMLMSREYGVEFPLEEAEQDMKTVIQMYIENK